MSIAAPNPAIAKDLKNGTLFCLICSIQVKSKLWTSHAVGRRHRDNIELLKKKHAAALANAAAAPKRPTTEPHDEAPTPPKKIKEDIYEEEVGTSSAATETPWQREKLEKGVKRAAVPKNVIEGVPDGFFDDNRLNSRVVEAIEKKANMEEEYSNFLRELNEAKQEEDEREDIEEQSSAIERDIQLIDEQIDHWRRVNRLELRREEICKAVVKETVEENGKMEGGDQSDDEDFDLEEALSWRNKTLKR